jgi:hypothetical protein
MNVSSWTEFAGHIPFARDRGLYMHRRLVAGTCQHDRPGRSRCAQQDDSYWVFNSGRRSAMSSMFPSTHVRNRCPIPAVQRRTRSSGQRVATAAVLPKYVERLGERHAECANSKSIRAACASTPARRSQTSFQTALIFMNKPPYFSNSTRSPVC